MHYNSLKTYMRKGGFRTSSRPSLTRPRKSGLAVVQQRAATLHYNCAQRDVNILASWIVPDSMAEDAFGGGVVLGWEIDTCGDSPDEGPQDRKPGNDYPVACSVRYKGVEQWVFFKLEDKRPPAKMDMYGLVPELIAKTRTLKEIVREEHQDKENDEDGR